MSPLKSRSLRFVAVVLFTLGGISGYCRAVVNGAPIPLTDRRFDAVGIIEALTNPPGACGGYIAGSCVLIAPNMILTARHSVAYSYQPLPPQGVVTHRVRFRRGANGTGFSVFQPAECGDWLQEINIVHLIGSPNSGMDMVIGILETPVVGIIPLALELNASPAAGSSFVLAGWGVAGTCFGEGGDRTLRSQTGTLPAAAVGGIFTFNLCTMSNCMICPPGQWAIANLFDSGAPLLMEVTCGASGARELRVFGLALGSGVAIRVSEWNRSGATPALATGGLVCHCCPGDFNQDGVITVQDIFSYLNAWFSGSTWAEIDGLPGLNQADIFAYLGVFFGGC